MSGRETTTAETAAGDGGRIVRRKRERRRMWGWAGAVLVALAGWILFEQNWPRLLERAALVDGAEAFAAPGEKHRWGTDHEGRELFARVLVGAAGTACVALLVGIVSYVTGTLLGIARSFVREPWLRPGAVVARAWFCFPMFFVVTAFVAASGECAWLAFAGLAAVGTFMVSRGVAETLSRVMGHASDRAALASAIPRARIWRHYRAPHARYAGYRSAWAVLPFALLWESALGFIGDGAAVSPFGLGHLIREGRLYFLDAPWLALIPGGALLALVFLARIGEAATGARFERHYSLLNDDNE